MEQDQRAVAHDERVGPAERCAAGLVTLISHDGTCCVGVNADPAAITAPQAQAAGLQAGLDKVVALAGVTRSRAEPCLGRSGRPARSRQ